MVNKPNPELTKRQRRVLQAVEAFILGHGYAPTIRRLGEELGITSPSAVFKHVRSLECKGYLSRREGDLSLAGRPAPAAGQVRVPLLGPVPAGWPREAFDLPGEAVDVPEWMVGRRASNVFCIRVEGKSMIDAHIDDGDRVVIERTDTAASGEMVVARLDDGSVTLKRLRRENGRILLVPENPEFAPLEVRELRVLGRVIGVLRKY
ncbi:MAG: repressor LexA [Candidatus Aminicenantes bacterium RBG_13_64_14]|nr:MAG: repressor LexA [Candidatus Aminicenantes bacterium RBG_13_64_14]